MTPSISIVIPSYNHGRFIAEAVDSVLASPLDDWALVVVDDGSTDDTLERLERYRSDLRVTILHQDNRGAHDALNRGVAAASADIVAILNSDDAYTPERLPQIVEHFARDPATVLVGSWLEVVDEEGESLGVKRGHHNMPPWLPPSSGPYLSDTGDLHLALLEGNYIATTSNVAFRRTLCSEHGLRFQPLRYAHDWDFELAACELGRIAVVEQPTVRYRVHGANTIREGRAADAGQGLMQFEILWVVARHAQRACAIATAGGRDPDDLRRRMWRSLPRFGHDDLLAALLALRGDAEDVPAAYDALLEEENPFRRAAIAALAESTEM